MSRVTAYAFSFAGLTGDPNSMPTLETDRLVLRPRTDEKKPT